MSDQTKIVGLIPAHLASIRLKRKVLIDILGRPMIEHVRRRALRSGLLDKVIVASGDNEILDTVTKYGGEVIKTYKKHMNGTSRAAEAIDSIDCTHIVVIQGDEPLIQKEHLENIVKAIKRSPIIDSWNSTCELQKKQDLDKREIVKAALNDDGRILYCFRRTPSYGGLSEQLEYIKKIQGLIAYKKDVLIKLSTLPASRCEKYESIEQQRIIANGFDLFSVQQNSQVPSINIKEDLDELFKYLKENKSEYKLLKEIMDV